MIANPVKNLPVQWRHDVRCAVMGLAVLAAAACSEPEPVAQAPEGPTTTPTAGRTLRIGDVDPDTPARRIQRLQPLAAYLAEELADLGITGGQVVIAQDLAEMARLLRDGEVDLYLDTAYPALLVQAGSGSEILLRRWAKGAPDYWSLFIASQESPVESLDDLRGRLLVLQDSYSTSGFVLPAGTLLELGFELEEVHSPDEETEPGVVHYLFSRDEENTIEMILTGRAPAGAISNQDWAELPAEVQSRLRIIDRTSTMPRQLLSVRAGLDEELVARTRAALLSLAGPDAEPVTLGESPAGWTWKFDAVSSEAAADLQRMSRFIQLLGLD